MNRQYKRMMKKEEDRKKGAPRPAVKPGGAPAKKERTKPGQFLKEVLGELKKVAWPTRPEVVAYSTVVLVASIVVAVLIFAMDYVFTEAVFALYGVDV